MKPALSSTVPPVISLIRCLHIVDSVYPNTDMTWKDAAKFYKSISQKLLADIALLPAKISSLQDLNSLKEIKQYCFGFKTPWLKHLTTYQKEVREVVRVLIHLFDFVRERQELQVEAPKQVS